MTTADETALLDAARRFVYANERLDGDPHPDSGIVIASLAARHDMNLLCGSPCGCDEGTCPGLLGADSQGTATTGDLCIGSYDLRTQVGSWGFYCTGCGMKDPPMDEDKGTVLPHFAAQGTATKETT